MSRTTSAPTDGRAKKMVAIIAGCRSFRTFCNCHVSTAFTTVGAQRILTRMFGQIWDIFEPKQIDPPDARWDFRGSTIQKSVKCYELPRKPITICFIKKNHHTPGGPSGEFRGSKKSAKCHGLPRKSIIFFKPPSNPVVGSFRAQHFQKSRKLHDLPRQLFHFKPLTPTHPGGAVLGDTGREGGGR